MSARTARVGTGRPASATAAATIRDVDLFRLFPAGTANADKARALVAMVKVLANGKTRVPIHDRTLWHALGWSESTYRRVKRTVARQLVDARGECLIVQRKSRSHGGLIACSWTLDRRRIDGLGPPKLTLIDGGIEDDGLAGARAAVDDLGRSYTAPPGITRDTTQGTSKTNQPPDTSQTNVSGGLVGAAASLTGPPATTAEPADPRLTPAGAGDDCRQTGLDGLARRSRPEPPAPADLAAVLEPELGELRAWLHERAALEPASDPLDLLDAGQRWLEHRSDTLDRSPIRCSLARFMLANELRRDRGLPETGFDAPRRHRSPDTHDPEGDSR